MTNGTTTISNHAKRRRALKAEKTGISFTVLKNSKGLMTKVISLDAKGKLSKKACCSLYEGRALKVFVESLQGFCDQLAERQPNEAHCYGISEHDDIRLVVQDNLQDNQDAIARDRDHFSYPECDAMMAFDHDAGDKKLSPSELIDIHRTLLPEAREVKLAHRPSASSCIRNSETGEEIAGVGGQRIYMRVSKGTDIPKIASVMRERAWALGLGEIKISKSGSLLDRWPFDSSVYKPEHIDFVAGAKCDYPLEQDLPQARIVDGFDECFDTSLLRDLDAETISKAETNRTIERAKKRPAAERVRAAWILRRSQELASKTGITIEDAKLTITAAAETSSLLPDFVIRTKDFGPVTVREILANPKRFHNTHCADPLDPDHDDDPRIGWINLKTDRPFVYSHAHGGQKFDLLDDVAVQGATANLIKNINQVFGLLKHGSDVLIVERAIDPTSGITDFRFFKKDAFLTLMANQPHPTNRRKNAGHYFLEHPDRRMFDALTFNPSSTPIHHLNLFQGWRVKAMQGESKLFWLLVKVVICAGNEQAYIYVRRWFAHLFQKPSELPEVSLVVRGPQGAGKNTVFDAVGHILGPHFIEVTSMEQITGRFTGHLKDCLLVVANEAVWGGTKAHAGALKAMITDKRVPVEMKGKDIVSIDNHRRLAVLTNESWAVPTDMDDRRFVFLNATADYVGNREFFNAVHTELKSGGYEAILFDLLAEDLSGFNPRERPDTGFGIDVKLRSANSVTQWWYEVLQQGYLECVIFSNITEPFNDAKWPDHVNKSSLYSMYLSCCQRQRWSPESMTSFFKTLKSLLPSAADYRPQPEKSAKKDIPKQTRVRSLKMPELAIARLEFETAARAVGQIVWQPD